MKPWFWLPAQLAHDIAPIGLRLMAAFRESRIYEWLPFSWQGLSFKNRLGIAGGVDKDGACVEDWWAFGPGFIEVGTVTPKPQNANPGQTIARDLPNGALWNRMGFPGKGAWHVRENLKDLPPERLTPVFVNIGRNRSTPNEAAAEDYVACIEIIGTLADAYVVNISSPNTQGLRELFQPHAFIPFLIAIRSARDRLLQKQKHLPLLLKLSPDLEEADLINVIEGALHVGIDGFIATNTTLARESNSPFPKEGGVSGRPLAQHSLKSLKALIRILGTRRKSLLIVSAGGVMTPDDVLERLDLGADLVQVYTGLVFEGPRIFEKVANRFNVI